MEVLNENKHDSKREDFEPQSKALVPSDIERYGDHYSENKLTSKLRKVAKRLGGKALEAALTLYYVLRSPSISTADKAKIYGVLGYFILPIDINPDLLPMIGYADDISALFWVMNMVWKNITPDVRDQARAKAAEIVGK